jgi:hypothetical protein
MCWFFLCLLVFLGFLFFLAFFPLVFFICSYSFLSVSHF